MALKMRELYKNIELELDKIKYEGLWPGFSRMPFVIYNKTKVFLKEEEIAGKFKYNIINIDDIKDFELEEYFREHINKIEKRFKDFFNQSVVKYEGDLEICGYDPMNMIKQRDEVLCNHFIMLMDKVSNKQLFLNEPIVVKLKKGTSNHVIEYYSKGVATC